MYLITDHGKSLWVKTLPHCGYYAVRFERFYYDYFKTIPHISGKTVHFNWKLSICHFIFIFDIVLYFEQKYTSIK